ncbi:MAG: GNAT family N-acetyltransferase [Chitinophagales bacterium]
MTNNWLTPITLEGQKVKLIPLDHSHKEALLKAANDGELSELWYTFVPSIATIDNYLDVAFEDQKKGNALPFVVVDKASGQIIGTTRYCNATPEHRRLEIGYTWYAKSYQRTGVNTECKFLLLQHAFENLDAIAVEFRTHWHNHQSRNAILRLGAKQDGVLRSHRIDSDGALRDTVVFSIIEVEWKTVKKSLQFKMKAIH